MAFSYGIWAERPMANGTLFRWEADLGEDGSGFVIFDPVTVTVRPSDGDGGLLGTLAMNGGTGELDGDSDGVDRVKFVQVASAILREHSKLGEIPSSAHTVYG
jgi:hypothetical protein